MCKCKCGRTFEPAPFLKHIKRCREVCGRPHPRLPVTPAELALTTQSGSIDRAHRSTRLCADDRPFAGGCHARRCAAAVCSSARDAPRARRRMAQWRQCLSRAMPRNHRCARRTQRCRAGLRRRRSAKQRRHRRARAYSGACGRARRLAQCGGGLRGFRRGRSRGAAGRVRAPAAVGHPEVGAARAGRRYRADGRRRRAPARRRRRR
jgi:hypothetical protein